MKSSLWRRVLESLTRQPSSAELKPEQRALLAKHSELEVRISHLESQVHGLDGRTSTLERRQRDDPNYVGPERRMTPHVTH